MLLVLLSSCVGISLAAQRHPGDQHRPSHVNRQNAASSIVVFHRQFSKDNGSSFYGSGSDGDPREPTSASSSSGGGSSSHSGGGGGDKRDGWLCPNCGELCSHVDLFICESVYDCSVTQSMPSVDNI